MCPWRMARACNFRVPEWEARSETGDATGVTVRRGVRYGSLGTRSRVRKHVSRPLLQPSPRAQHSIRPHGLARRSTLARNQKRPAARGPGKLEPLRAFIPTATASSVNPLP
eukprot:5433793-Prymnesium_polylepis.2